LPLGWVSGVGVPSLLGAATNLKDGLVWLALPLLLADQGFDLTEIGAVAGLYPLVWAVSQLLFGPLSDRWGRKGFILGGIVLQGLGLLALGAFGGYPAMLLAALLLGLGTGMSYPTLIARVADRAATAKRATALGIYRFFRDGGYAAGAALGIVFAVMPQAIIAVGLAFLVLAGLAARRL
jgi:MFS family permease